MNWKQNEWAFNSQPRPGNKGEGYGGEVVAWGGMPKNYPLLPDDVPALLFSIFNDLA